MTFTAGNFILIASIIIFVGLLVSRAGYKFGVPVLLLFLLVGMLFGTDGLGIEFDNMKLAQFTGMISMSIILFSGGMDTDIRSIRPVILPGIALSTVGVLLTAVITGAFIYAMCTHVLMLPGYTFAVSMLLASTMASTDSASVFNVLRSKKMGLKHNLKPLLEFESGSNDPVAYILTILMIQIITAGAEASVGRVLMTLFMQLAIGGVAGYLMGKASVWVTNRVKLHYSSLYPILMLCIIFFTFSVTDLLDGNGYLAVYVAGIIVGNSPLVNKRETARFLDGMTWLFQIVMFLMLGLLVNPSEMWKVVLPALLIGAFMIFVGRPASVFLTLLPFRKISARSKLYLSWVGLRGAAPIIFATYPVLAGIEGAENIFNIVFFITILSLVVQGSTVSSAAGLLHLKMNSPKEGNDFGVELPEDLKSKVWDITVDEGILSNGPRLMDVGFPKGVLAIMVRRGEDYVIPNGDLVLEVGDKMLLIAAEDALEPERESASPDMPSSAFPDGLHTIPGLVYGNRGTLTHYKSPKADGTKVILYIHGMGGGGDSRIPSILKEHLPAQYRVVIRTYSFNPDEAYGQIAAWMDELSPDLVIGESLGAVQAIRIKGVPHILVSPSLNAPLYLYYASFLTWIPGVSLLLGRKYRPKPGDRQGLIFNKANLRPYFRHRERALLRSPKVLGKRADEFFAFFGDKDAFRRSGIVSVSTYEKYFFHTRDGKATYAMYPGTHFMENEYVLSMLIPKILEITGNSPSEK